MHDPATVPVLALLMTHFDTRYGARDDAAHLATYADGAYLVLGDKGVKKADADPARVLAAWAQVPRDREPQFLAPSLVEWRPEGDRGIAVVDVREAVTGTPVLVGVGLVQEPDWKIDFAAIVDGTPRGYDQQRMIALTELAGLKAASLEGPLTSLLEASYMRRHHLPKARLLALPETHFSCAGTGSCCRHELTIGMDDNSVAFLEAVDWQALVPQIGPGPYTQELPPEAAGLVSFRHKLARAEDGRCRFLTTDNRCSIHALAGRAVFKPCHVFPYRFALTPDGVAVTVNHMCPTARFAKGAPLASQEGDLRSRLAVSDVLRADAYYLRPAEEIPWEVFRTIEGQFLELLNAEAPIKQKLWVALRWLAARLDDPAAGVPDAWFHEPIPRLGWLQRTAFQRFGKLFDPCFKDMRKVQPGEGLLPEHEAELTRFFRSIVFSKVTTYPYGLVAGLNYVALIHHVLERQVAKHGARGLSEGFWQEFYAVVTAGTFFPVLQVCHRTAATGLARHAGDPAFGLTLLRT
jgi:hypothetical protein